MSKAYASKSQGSKKTRSSASASKTRGKSVSKGVKTNDRKELDRLNATGSIAELQQALSHKKKAKKPSTESQGPKTWQTLSQRLCELYDTISAAEGRTTFIRTKPIAYMEIYYPFTYTEDVLYLLLSESLYYTIFPSPRAPPSTSFLKGSPSGECTKPHKEGASSIAYTDSPSPDLAR